MDMDGTSYVPCVGLKVLMVTALAKRFGEFQSPKGSPCLQKMSPKRCYGARFVKLGICCLRLNVDSAIDLFIIV